MPTKDTKPTNGKSEYVWAIRARTAWVIAIERPGTFSRAALICFPVCEVEGPAFSLGMQAQIRAELAKVKPGATQCPGKLSRNLGRTLRELRPTLEAMARAGEINFYQRGRPVIPGQFKGPFRVAAKSGRG